MPEVLSDTDQLSHTLVTSREPVGPVNAGDPGSRGDQALKDAIGVIVAGWILLFLLAWSVRRHNV